MTLPVRVLIVEDHALVREGLKMLLSLDPALKIVGDTGDGVEVIRLAQSLQPDLVLLDLDLPRSHGAEVASQLKREFPAIKVLILTGCLQDASVRHALAAGADGYVVKHEDSEELLRAIPAVLADQCFISPAVAKAAGGDGTKLPVLTVREREILAYIAQGKSNQDIATTLSLSVHTVRTHRQNIMEKLDVHNVAEMTAWAIRHSASLL